jgi:hypothetical protein
MLRRIAERHTRVGWLAIVIFTGMGIVLDALHGFKVPWYLSVATQARRHMWTLCHSHGTLLGVLNLLFAQLCSSPSTDRVPRLASRALVAATLLMPSGFFLGGMVVHGGDPGVGAVLVPIGGGLTWIAVALAAHAAWVRRASRGDREVAENRSEE